MTDAYQFAPHERPMFPGSPYSPAHPATRRLAYFATGLLIGTCATFSNGLTNVNVANIAGSLGLYAAEATMLPALYVAINASANLTLVKARAQFGIPEVTGGLLALDAAAALFQFAMPGLGAALLIRAVNGMAAAALITLAIYYLMQGLPPRAKPLGAVVGIGLPQLGTPLARLVPVEYLAQDNWWGLHAIELAVALGALALILVLPLPPSERSKAFEPLDLVTIGLATIGMVLLCEVIGLGRTLWWTDAPQLGWILAFAIPLLAAAFIIEVGRSRPLVHFEWIGTLGILRFAGVALLVRLALGEQTFGIVGLLSSSGLNNDQFHGLFTAVVLAMIAGVAAGVLTLSERRLPWQVLVASLVIAGGAWLDSGANALTRPAQVILSQALVGFGTTLFIGPALLYGFLRMIRRGGDHLVSFVVVFSITQNIGGLLGSALLGSLQTIWSRNAAAVLAGDMASSDPQVAARLAAGLPQLNQALAREAGVIAYTDTFRLVALLALGTALFVATSLAIAAFRRSRESDQ